MLRDPRFEEGSRASKGLTHRRAAIRDGVEPEWEPNRLLNQAAGSVLNLPSAFLDPGRQVRDVAHWHEVAARELSAVRRADRRTIANYCDIEIVAYPLFLRAFDDEVL